MIIIFFITTIIGQVVIPSIKQITQEGFNQIRLACSNFAVTSVGSFSVVITSQYNIPIICESLTITVSDSSMTVQFTDLRDCDRFSFDVYNTRSAFILTISSYYTYALTNQFDIAIDYRVAAQTLLSVKKPLNGASLVMKDYSTYTEQNITGTITNLFISYTPQWYLLKSSYFILDLYYRDFQNLENANIISFTSLTPQCQGVLGINVNLNCFIQGNSLYIKNVADSKIIPPQVLIKVEGFITTQNMFSYQLGMQLNLYQSIFGVYHLFESSLATVQLQTTEINNKLAFKIGLSNNQVSQYNEITFTINYFDFLYSWTRIIINFPTNFITDFTKIKLIPIENMITNPTLTYSGVQLQIESCLSNFLPQNSIIKFVISTINPDIVYNYDDLQLSLQDDEVAEYISQSEYQSIQITNSFLSDVIVNVKDLIVGIFTDFQFIFTCKSNLPQNTYLVIEFDDSVSLNGNIIPVGQTNVNPSPNIIVNKQTLRLNGWSNNQIQTANSTRTLLIKNIQNPLYISSNMISYSINIYQQNDILHDTYQGNISISLQQFQIIIQSANYNQQITNSISQLNILIQIQSNIIKGDLVKIILTENDYDSKLMKSSIQCFIGSFQQVCYKQKGVLVITSQGTYQNSLNIIIRNLVTPRSLKSTPISLIIERAGYQIASSDNFGLKLTDMNEFQSLNLKAYSLQENSSVIYDFQFQTSTDLMINEQLILKFQDQLDFQLEFGFTATQNRIDDYSIQIQIGQNLISGINYNLKVLVNNQSGGSNSIQFDLKAQSKDQLGILKSSLQYQIVAGPKMLEKFTFQQDNQFINYQNNMNLYFRSNFNLSSNNTASLVVPLEFTNVNIINLMNQKINYSSQSNQTQLKINFNLVDQEQGKEFMLSLINITNPILQQQNFAIFLNIYDKNNILIEYGMIQIGPYKCNNYCNTCNTENVCLTCQEGYILTKGMCVLNCRQDEIFYNNSCQSCLSNVQNCKVCNQYNLTQCELCNDNLILIDQNCINNTQNITQQQMNTTNKGLISIKPQIRESVFEKLYYGLFNYINFLVMLLMMIWKIKRNKFQLIQGYLSYIGLCDPIAHFISFIYFIVYDQQYQFLITGGLIFTRILYLVNCQVFLIPQIQSEKQVQRYLYKQNAIKLILQLTKYYDWKLSFLLNSRITDDKIFKIEFVNHDQVNKSLAKLLNWGFIYINPLQIMILIITVSTDYYNTAVFQVEYLVFMILNQMFLIIKAYQLEAVRSEDFEGLHQSDILQ